MNGFETMCHVDVKIHDMNGTEECNAVQMREIWSYIYKLRGSVELKKMTKQELLDLIDEMKLESPVEFEEWEGDDYENALRYFKTMVYRADDEVDLKYEVECGAEEMVRDIHFLLTSLYLWYSSAGRNAYDSKSFKMLAEKYLLHVRNVEEASEKRDELKKILDKIS